MSANIADSPGHAELLEKKSKKQFPNKDVNDLIKKIIDKRQKNEYLRANKYSEGLCYCCDEYKYVLPTLVDACIDCTMKRSKDAVLAVAARSFYGYCFLHGGMSKIHYKNNWAQLNVRVCDKCSHRIRLAGRKISGGMKAVDPFWKYARKRLGKDFEQYVNPHSAPRNFWKK